MKEKLIALLVFVVLCFFSYKLAENSAPPSFKNFYFKYQFNFLTYLSGLLAIWLFVEIVIEYFFES